MLLSPPPITLSDPRDYRHTALCPALRGLWRSELCSLHLCYKCFPHGAALSPSLKKKKSVCHLAQIKDMVLKPYGQTQPIDTFSFSVNNHVPSVYRSAIDLLNPNASLCIFHQYFTWMLCLEKGMVGPMPMSAAPWSQDEGLSERRDCICSCCVESSRVC